MSNEPIISEAPIMLRAKITRAELKDAKRIAFETEQDFQDWLGDLIRERIAKEDA